MFDARLHNLLDDMRDTLTHSQGVGLAAVQVGVLWRACLVMTPDGVLELINPQITSQGKSKIGEEGCLSVPDVNVRVARPNRVTVTALDRNGKPFKVDLKGLAAVCTCHEIDHLNGILLTDRAEGAQ